MDKYSIIEVISPQKAAEYLTHNHKNRRCNEALVEYYAEQMRKGEWKFNGQGITFCENGNLADGQHRLRAIIKAEISIKMNVVRGAANDCFDTIDTGRNRTASDILDIVGVPNYSWVASAVQRYARLCNGQSPMTSGGNSKAKGGITKAQVLSLYEQHPEVFQASALLGSSATRGYRSLGQTEVAGIAAYLTLHLGHRWGKVEEFFRLIDNDEATECNTITSLRRRLRRESAGAIQRSTPQYRLNILIRTWNDYVRGKNDRKDLKWNKEAEGQLQFI